MLTARRLLLLGLLGLTLSAREVRAYHVGIAGYSGKNNGAHCTSCHSGGQVPTVAFTGPTSLRPGQVGDFTFTVTSADPDLQSGAGFDVAASGGTLQVVTPIAQKERLLSGELTHSSPRANDASGQVTWSFKWKAPTVAGNYTLYGAGNSVNRDGGNSGDRSATSLLEIAVGNTTPTPSVTDTAEPALTPTDSPTVAPSPTPPQSPTSSAIPSPTPTASPTHTATATPTPPPSTTGDATCDGVVTAADLPALVSFASTAAPGACGADTDRNGVVNIDDLQAAINLTFEP